MAGKHMESRKRIKLSTVLVIAAALALVTAIGGTMAWLTTHSEGLTNTFTPADIKGTIVENFDDKTTKKDVKIQNDSDVPVYVRVALVPTWVNAAQEPMAEPCSLNDLLIKPTASAAGVSGEIFTPDSSSGWVKGADGYYYYTTPVAAGTTTNPLFAEATVKANKTPAGCTMNLQVLLQMIQAEGVNAEGKRPVELAWGVSVNADGTISK